MSKANAEYLPFQPGFEHQNGYRGLVVPYDSPIADSVSDFYQFQVAPDQNTTFTIPDGCADFMFIIRDTDVHGMMTIGKDYIAAMHLDKRAQVFGVRFRPGAIKLLLGVPAKNVVNSRIPLCDLSAHRDMAGQIASCLNFENRVAAATEHIWHTLHGNSQSRSIADYCVGRIIETSGSIPVQTLVDETAYSIRYLQTIFADRIGFSPKHFCSIMKLQKSLMMIVREQQCRRLSDVALDCGYYDQSHMNRSYQKLVGMVPSKFLSLKVGVALNESL